MENQHRIPVTPLLAVDAVILYNEEIVVIKRLNNPFQGQYALPGGFVDVGETVENAVIREAKEETNLSIKIMSLVGVYSEPTRDERKHIVSLCYLARGSGELKAGSDAKDIRTFQPDKLPTLAFDHNEMVRNALLLNYSKYWKFNTENR